MQNVRILCVGKLKEAYWVQACEEYKKRLQAYCQFSVVEIPEVRLPEDPSETQIAKALQAEGKKLLEAAGNAYIVPLCIEGEKISSVQLGTLLQKAANTGSGSVCFVIGSSFGLSDEVKAAGKKRISMSDMTFPHQLARVMLCEQVYRAFSILAHTKYHK